MNILPFIRTVRDFPKPGVTFRDITPLLSDPQAFEFTINWFVEQTRSLKVDAVVAVESRGFIFASPVALKLKLPLVIVRKAGKLPAARVAASYSLEYGANTIEMHSDSLKPGAKVVVIDDVLATGGTANATGRLVSELKGQVASYLFLIELADLNGKAALGSLQQVSSLVLL